MLFHLYKLNNQYSVYSADSAANLGGHVGRGLNLNIDFVINVRAMGTIFVYLPLNIKTAFESALCAL